ncbi:hypothetical protein GWI33_012409, partial [Rhynchophorus ferrugineus]
TTFKCGCIAYQGLVSEQAQEAEEALNRQYRHFGDPTNSASVYISALICAFHKQTPDRTAERSTKFKCTCV